MFGPGRAADNSSRYADWLATAMSLAGEQSVPRPRRQRGRSPDYARSALDRSQMLPGDVAEHPRPSPETVRVQFTTHPQLVFSVDLRRNWRLRFGRRQGRHCVDLRTLPAVLLNGRPECIDGFAGRGADGLDPDLAQPRRKAARPCKHPEPRGAPATPSSRWRLDGTVEGWRTGALPAGVRRPGEAWAAAGPAQARRPSAVRPRTRSPAAGPCSNAAASIDPGHCRCADKAQVLA